MSMVELDPEEKQKRIDRLIEHTKEEIVYSMGYCSSRKIERYYNLHGLLSGVGQEGSIDGEII